MSFWTDPHDQFTPFAEPKRPYRFIAKLGNFLGGTGLNATRAQGLPEYLWYAKSFDKPAFSIESSEHKMINKTFKYPKTVTWSDVKIVLVDTDCPSVPELVGRYLEDAGGMAGYGNDFYNANTKQTNRSPTDPTGDRAAISTMVAGLERVLDEMILDLNEEPYTTVTKAAAVASLGQVKIWQLDSCGRALEEWQLHNAWIKEANFGKLSYDNNDFMEIELTICYDWAVVAVGGTPYPATDLNSEMNQRARMAWWNGQDSFDSTAQPSRNHYPNRDIYANGGACGVSYTPAPPDPVQEPGQESTIESTDIPVFDGIIDENIG